MGDVQALAETTPRGLLERFAGRTLERGGQPRQRRYHVQKALLGHRFCYRGNLPMSSATEQITRRAIESAAVSAQELDFANVYFPADKRRAVSAAVMCGQVFESAFKKNALSSKALFGCL